ncbi:MAG TPA: DUF305 domain-containing protein [Solirubrobacterales bacterium]|nr:DUF305 domain-containing protein [Solirubrobacterales bacterium]
MSGNAQPVATRSHFLALAACLAALVAATVLASCGDGDSADAKETDGAFIVAMVPHHESAIEMAEIAAEEGEHPQVKELARRIVATQAAEIDELERIHRRLFGQPIGQASHGTLGMPARAMGMGMDASELMGAKPFDREFIDMMVPHHQGAIRMARVELARGEDPELMRIAKAIIDAQAGEIEEMNRWRSAWHGKPSPAGGMPAEGGAMMPSHEEMGH